MNTRTAPSTPAVEETARQTIARRALTAQRLAMGIFFLVCGLSGLVNLLPHAGAADSAALGGWFMKAGFVFPLLKGAEVLLEVYLGWAGRKA